jgi:Holliday junction resolvase-like predicted endonuclease
VEVKTRKGVVSPDDYPEDAVTSLKLHHMFAVAEAYMRAARLEDVLHRFDVVAICIKEKGRPEVVHLKGV